MMSSTWNPWKFNRNFSLSRYHEYMHLGESLEYQFVVEYLREIMSDLKKVASSPPDEVMEIL
jgi:hypothetical protein